MAVTSLFDGMDAQIGKALGLATGQHLKQKSTCKRLKSACGAQDAVCSLVPKPYDDILSKGPFRSPSHENWRLERVTTLVDKNKSQEVVLERAVAVLAENGFLNTWYNQIPVASGVLNGFADKRAAVDWVDFRGDRASLVELKWESDTPAYAAFEILRYGLAYLLCRDHKQEFGYEDKKLLSVDDVELQVLAPKRFYDKCDLRFLQEGIGSGLEKLCAGRKDGLRMNFVYRSFSAEFDLPFVSGAEVARIRNGNGESPKERALIEAMNSTELVWV